jgi:DNA polymerase III subunit epsilon
MTQVLILDTETSDLPENDGRCLEVAVARYSLDHACVIETYSSLVRGVNENPAQDVNGIIPASLRLASETIRVWQRVGVVAQGCTAILAHGAEFDQKFVPAFALPWVCTMSDMRWPRKQGPERMSLVALALKHGLGVSHAHRASVDVDLIARLLTRAVEMGGLLDAMLAYGMRPKGTYVSLAPYSKKDLVKKHGFGWVAGEKKWKRTMAHEDVAGLPFKVKEVET